MTGALRSLIAELIGYDPRYHPADRAEPPCGAKGGDAEGRFPLPPAASPPEPMTSASPLGEVASGPLWSAGCLSSGRTVLVGPGVTLTLDDASVVAIAQQLSIVVAMKGLDQNGAAA